MTMLLDDDFLDKIDSSIEEDPEVTKRNKLIDYVLDFSQHLNPERAAYHSGMTTAKAAAALQASPEAQTMLKEEMSSRAALYEAVPASIIRAELLKVFMSDKTKDTAKVSAGKILVDLMNNNTDADKNILDLITALKTPV